jgi:hypothetical protein
MEKKPDQPKRRSNDAPNTDVDRDLLAHILTALFVMNEATNRWKRPHYLAYDTYDARLRSFFTWPKHMHPSPTALSTAGFFYVGKNIISPT